MLKSCIAGRSQLIPVFRLQPYTERFGCSKNLAFSIGTISATAGRDEETSDDHHDHLIDMRSGDVVEFQDAEIEALQQKIAARLGYRLAGHRLELYGTPLDYKEKAEGD